MFDNVPLIAFWKKTRSPVKALMFWLPGVKVAPDESCRKLAVRVLVPAPRMVAGLGVLVHVSQGVKAAADMLLTPSQPALPGPCLQPHQLSVAVTAPEILFSPLPCMPVFPTIRLKLILKMFPLLLST